MARRNTRRDRRRARRSGGAPKGRERRVRRRTKRRARRRTRRNSPKGQRRRRIASKVLKHPITGAVIKGGSKALEAYTGIPSGASEALSHGIKDTITTQLDKTTRNKRKVQKTKASIRGGLSLRKRRRRGKKDERKKITRKEVRTLRRKGRRKTFLKGMIREVKEEQTRKRSAANVGPVGLPGPVGEPAEDIATDQPGPIGDFIGDIEDDIENEAESTTSKLKTFAATYKTHLLVGGAGAVALAALKVKKVL